MPVQLGYRRREKCPMFEDRDRPLFTALSRLLDAYTRGDVVSTRDIIEQLKTEMDPRMPEEELAIVIAREASGRGISIDLDSRD